MYIVKFACYDNDPLTDRKWYDVYVSSVSFSAAGVSYATVCDRGEALMFPKAVAEWICQILDGEGLYPMMERV